MLTQAPKVLKSGTGVGGTDFGVEIGELAPDVAAQLSLGTDWKDDTVLPRELQDLVHRYGIVVADVPEEAEPVTKSPRWKSLLNRDQRRDDKLPNHPVPHTEFPGERRTLAFRFPRGKKQEHGRNRDTFFVMWEDVRDAIRGVIGTLDECIDDALFHDDIRTYEPSRVDFVNNCDAKDMKKAGDTLKLFREDKDIPITAWNPLHSVLFRVAVSEPETPMGSLFASMYKKVQHVRGNIREALENIDSIMKQSGISVAWKPGRIALADDTKVLHAALWNDNTDADPQADLMISSFRQP